MGLGGCEKNMWYTVCGVFNKKQIYAFKTDVYGIPYTLIIGPTVNAIKSPRSIILLNNKTILINCCHFQIKNTIKLESLLCFFHNLIVD